MIEFLKKIGIVDGDSLELQLKKYRLLLITLGCLLIAPLFSYAYYRMGLELSAIVPLAYMLCLLPSLIIFASSGRYKALLNSQMFLIFTCPVTMQWLAGGFLKGGVVILWAFLAPLTALIFMELRKAKIWMFLLVAAIIATAVFNNYFEQFGTYADKQQRVIQLSINLLGGIGLIYFAIQYFVHTVKRTNKVLEEEKLRADSLLRNILPAHVAEELKSSGKASPTLYKNVSIIFSDFKDFTQFSELFTPEELIEELDNCFLQFDEIISRNGLEKIKTIGDAYMCVAGMSEKNNFAANNAVLAVRAAVEMADYVKALKKKKLSEGKVSWDMRIGVHTGDVVAGIIGKHKFAFDIWGDAVNIASRLETCGEEGKINISGSTFALIKDYFHCTHRGKMAVKNKGELDMYFVDGPILHNETSVSNQTVPVLATS